MTVASNEVRAKKLIILNTESFDAINSGQDCEGSKTGLNNAEEEWGGGGN